MTETKYPNAALPAMEVIEKIDAGAAATPYSLPEVSVDHPVMQQWLAQGSGLLDRLAHTMGRRGVHPARTVVVLPFAHLRPLAARLWAQRFPDGFAPRFETSMSWSTSLGPWSAGPTDIAFDAALDSLTAQAMLEQVGLGEQSISLTGLLVQLAHQIGPLAAACPEERRSQWAAAARAAVVLGMDSTALAWETAVGQVAVEWAAVSNYASDILLSPQTMTTADAILLVQGLAMDPIAAGLLEAWQGKAEVIPFLEPKLEATTDATGKPIQSTYIGTQLHSCLDAEDEAQRAAACLIRHIAQGRFPVALVSSDRALTRRVRAMLEAAEVQIRDETGWKLSTSYGAAQVMALLRACAWNASTDDVLAWLKAAPVYARMASEVEALARREQVREWRKFGTCSALRTHAHLLLAHSGIEQQRARFKGVRSLQSWLVELRLALQESGIWDALQSEGVNSDMTTHSLIDVLRLGSPSTPEWDALQTDALWARRRFDLADFTAWVNQTFEGASASPAYPALEQVVILPMSQMMGRPFAALVLAGCDEVRLNPSTDPPGNWTAAQREALGLPSREHLEAQSRLAWLGALATPSCDVLWRTSDDAGESLQPSVLVQLLKLDIATSGAPHMASTYEDPRCDRHVPAQPVARPIPVGAAVLPTQLSASAYDDLRTCPYRFFAMRQLGLQASDELDAEIDKRDFGLWLHEVLKRFHEGLQLEPTSDRARRTSMLQAASEQSTLSMGLSEGEFLPFSAAWPALREHYLDWCETHDKTSATFASAETSHTQNLGPITLVGRIDRIDRLPDGSHWVMDYKTEPMAKTQARIKDPFEDTQIAFYAALLPDDTLDAAYINISERDATRTVPQADIVQARDALLEAMLGDMAQIQSGAALPALGEGIACDYCKARGLCRKDFWVAP